jgi:hypothetical protein|tara:strand:+ start:926 stop:1795 length:870 start_codon:yes stop_codon:yes gene_type:complete
MRIIILLFIFLISNNAFSKDKNCSGFCKGEKYVFGKPQIIKDKYPIGKKKYKVWVVNRGFGVKDSKCLPYFQTNTYGRKNKKFFPDIDNLYMSTFEMNACGPCSLLYGNEKGFCPIPLYTLEVIYQNAVNDDFPPKDYRDKAWWWYGEQLDVGRDYESEAPQIKKYMQEILVEKIVFTISPKKQLEIYKLKYEGTEAFAYEQITFKTPLKEQMIKMTDTAELTDYDAIDIVNNFIIKIQQNMDVMYGKGEKKDFFNTKLFYDSIPTDDEINTLTETFPELKEFHYQLRN